MKVLEDLGGGFSWSTRVETVAVSRDFCLDLEVGEGCGEFA